jgi:hypothetical protein
MSDLVEVSIKVDPNEAVEANERFVELPPLARFRHGGRAADEDQDGARVLHREVAGLSRAPVVAER